MKTLLFVFLMGMFLVVKPILMLRTGDVRNITGGILSALMPMTKPRWRECRPRWDNRLTQTPSN